MKSRRSHRVAQLLKEEISRLISREQTLESLLITVTEVDPSPDLKQACVYFSSLNPKVPTSQIAEQLSRHSHDWHQRLGKRVHMKYVPRLTFAGDDTLERGDRVLKILRELDEPEERDSRRG